MHENIEHLREIQREIVSALIISADNKILMGKKKKGGVYEDVWHLPGGGADDGEGLIQALIREIYEETRIEIDNTQVELMDDKGRGASEKTLKDTGEKVWCQMKFNVYKVSLSKNADEVQLPENDEIDDLYDLNWFDISELPNLPLTPPSVELFKRIGYIR